MHFRPRVSGSEVRWLVFFLCWFSGATLAAAWSVTVDEGSGLPTIAKGGRIAMSGSFFPLAKKTANSNRATEFHVVGPFDYRFLYKGLAGGYEIAGSITKPGNRQMVWQFDAVGPDTVQERINRGLTFKFDLETFGPELGAPRLLPANRGWVWGKDGNAESGAALRSTFG